MTMETSKETTTGEARGATPQGELKLVASTPKSAGAAAKTGAPPPAIEPPAFGSVDVEAFSRNLARVTLKEAAKLNTLDLVQYGKIVVSTKALEKIIARANGGQS